MQDDRRGWIPVSHATARMWALQQIEDERRRARRGRPIGAARKRAARRAMALLRTIVPRV